MSIDRWLMASVLQLLVLGTFVYAVVIVLRQKRLSEVRDDFINNMTHEFKTPIASIESGAQLLGRDEIGSDPEARRKYLDLILAENKRMRRQVEKVMEIATLDGQVQRLSSDPIDLKAWVEEGVAAFRPSVELAEGQLTLSLSTEESNKRGLSSVLVGDRTHLDGVLSNLLDNALQHRGEAPPKLHVEFGFDSALGGCWKVSVTDSGPGIPEGHRERIFERFHRVPAGDRHDVKGFGLGLHYVRTIVEAHRGTVTCTAAPGGGSTFTVLLPYLAT